MYSGLGVDARSKLEKSKSDIDKQFSSEVRNNVMNAAKQGGRISSFEFPKLSAEIFDRHRKQLEDEHLLMEQKIERDNDGNTNYIYTITLLDDPHSLKQANPFIGKAIPGMSSRSTEPHNLSTPYK
jgi:hypothetical protein